MRWSDLFIFPVLSSQSKLSWLSNDIFHVSIWKNLELESNSETVLWIKKNPRTRKISNACKYVMKHSNLQMNSVLDSQSDARSIYLILFLESCASCSLFPILVNIPIFYTNIPSHPLSVTPNVQQDACPAGHAWSRLMQLRTKQTNINLSACRFVFDRLKNRAG